MAVDVNSDVATTRAQYPQNDSGFRVPRILYFSPARFFPSIMTHRKMRFIRVW